MFLLHAVAQLARERECCDESGNKENRLPPFTECSNVTINFSVHIESILKFVIARLHFSHGLYMHNLLSTGIHVSTIQQWNKVLRPSYYILTL